MALGKDVLGTAPTKVVLNLELGLYIGDGIRGSLFTSKTMNLKGVGVNENKAYISAVKRLNPNNKNIQSVLDEAKKKIMAYYNSNCESLIKEAQNLENQNRLQESLAILISVPENSSCFSRVERKVSSLYQKTIDRDCKKKLLLATSIWSANQDLNAANEAGGVLASIDPYSEGFSQVQVLFSKIETRAKELGDRDWELTLKKVELEKSAIQSARDVGIAFGKGLQNTSSIYNIKGWY